MHDKGKLNATNIQKTMDSLGLDASTMIEQGRADNFQERERSLHNANVVDSKEDWDAEMKDASGTANMKAKNDVEHLSLSVAPIDSQPRELKDEATVEKGWLEGWEWRCCRRISYQSW